MLNIDFRDYKSHNIFETTSLDNDVSEIEQLIDWIEKLNESQEMVSLTIYNGENSNKFLVIGETFKCISLFLTDDIYYKLKGFLHGNSTLLKDVASLFSYLRKILGDNINEKTKYSKTKVKLTIEEIQKVRVHIATTNSRLCVMMVEDKNDMDVFYDLFDTKICITKQIKEEISSQLFNIMFNQGNVSITKLDIEFITLELIKECLNGKPIKGNDYRFFISGFEIIVGKKVNNAKNLVEFMTFLSNNKDLKIVLIGDKISHNENANVSFIYYHDTTNKKIKISSNFNFFLADYVKDGVIAVKDLIIALMILSSLDFFNENKILKIIEFKRKLDTYMKIKDIIKNS